MYLKISYRTTGIAKAIPAKSDTRMNVAKFSVGARVVHCVAPDGTSRKRTMCSAKANDTALVTSTAMAAIVIRFRSSSRCASRESSLSRSEGVMAIQ